MISAKRHYAGKRAVRDGDQFELLIASNAHKSKMAVEHLPKSGARFIRKGVYKPLPMPFDMVLGHESLCAFIDAKSINQNTFPYSLVKTHQIIAMQKWWERGHQAGLIISFEPLDKIFYFNLDVILDLKRGDSLNESNSTCLLGTRWSMDLTKIFTADARINKDLTP